MLVCNNFKPPPTEWDQPVIVIGMTHVISVGFKIIKHS